MCNECAPCIVYDIRIFFFRVVYLNEGFIIFVIVIGSSNVFFIFFLPFCIVLCMVDFIPSKQAPLSTRLYSHEFVFISFCLLLTDVIHLCISLYLSHSHSIEYQFLAFIHLFGIRTDSFVSRWYQTIILINTNKKKEEKRRLFVHILDFSAIASIFISFEWSFWIIFYSWLFFQFLFLLFSLSFSFILCLYANKSTELNEPTDKILNIDQFIECHKLERRKNEEQILSSDFLSI